MNFIAHIVTSNTGKLYFNNFLNERIIMAEKKKQIDKVAADIKKGSFHKWLGKKEGEPITEADIKKGLKSKDTAIMKMAMKAKPTKIAKEKIAKESISELNSIRIQSEIVSLESFTGADIKNLLTNTLPSIVSDVKSFFNKFSPSAPGITSVINGDKFIRNVGKHNYLEISPLAAFVPEGLVANYVDYSNVLLIASEHASKILSEVMNNYTLFLGQLINNQDFKFSTKYDSDDYNELEHMRLNINEEIGKCFKLGSTKTEVTIASVVDRNADWSTVISNADTISKAINSVDRKTLNKKIQESVELLDIILNKIKRDEFSGVTPEVLRTLSAGAYQTASELEFFAVLHYRVLAFLESINRTIEHFNCVIK